MSYPLTKSLQFLILNDLTVPTILVTKTSLFESSEDLQEHTFIGLVSSDLFVSVGAALLASLPSLHGSAAVVSCLGSMRSLTYTITCFQSFVKKGEVLDPSDFFWFI